MNSGDAYDSMISDNNEDDDDRSVIFMSGMINTIG